MMKKTGKKVNVDLQLSIDGERISFSVQVPKGMTTVRRMLPVFRSVCGTVVKSAVEGIEESGRRISCDAGCGACCRQLVPISEVEALHLRDVVEQMPEETRRKIKVKCTDAMDRLAAANMMERLTAYPQPIGREFHELGIEYFRLGIPCPFLEDESCSIHPERPVVCREYLVVSPPENCKRNNGQPVDVIGLPLRASTALQTIGSSNRDRRWVPLVLALEQNIAEPIPALGTKIIDDFFRELIKRDPGSPQSAN